VVVVIGHIVATKAMPNFGDSAFSAFSREQHVSTVKELVEGVASEMENHSVVEAFLKSLRALAPLCKSIVELNYLAEIQTVIQLATEKAPDGMYFHATLLCLDSADPHFPFYFTFLFFIFYFLLFFY
jgi:hypothetical protein